MHPRDFSLGFLAAAIFTIVLMCTTLMCSSGGGDEADDETDGDDLPDIDITLIEDGADAAEEAFLSGDPEEVLAVMSEQAREFYGDKMAEVSDRLVEFGEAIKTRELGDYGYMFAEYNFTVDGETYSMAFVKNEDEDAWKLARF